MTIRQLALGEYISLTSSLPIPTVEQMEDFTRFVSKAHSWYKHLPLLMPGVPLYFFLDPTAGMQRIVRSDGSLTVSERVETGLHYSWIPTVEYRSRFGYLAFSKTAGSSVSLVGSSGETFISSDDGALIYDSDGGHLCRLPHEVLEAGTACVSGVIHSLAADAQIWIHQLRRTPVPEWPAESGGADVLQKIFDRCRTILQDRSKIERLSFDEWRASTNSALRQDDDLPFVDLPLYELLTPERRRQQSQMIEAMKRVLMPSATGAA
jgi:hypothetical protein